MTYSLFQTKRWSIFFVLFVILLLKSTDLIAVESDKKDTTAQLSNSQNTKTVSNINELRFAVNGLKAGDKILIEPGFYKGGFGMRGIQGTMKNPIIIEGKNMEDPPIFSGKGEGVKLSSVAYVKLRNLNFISFSGNGINIDDGGNNEKPSHHIIIEQITIKDLGPRGNNDAIKMSGVDDFIIRDCRIEGWGGSGIDLVGCHQGIIQACQFHGVSEYRTKNAIQIKGGSNQILVQESVFINSGERVINIGGSTGVAYFRPKYVDYETKNVIVAGNRFIGGTAQVAWVTSRNTYVHHNIFYLPEKFVGRILQETKDKRFKPCQKGLFEANLVVTDNHTRTFFNVGLYTSPETFTFLHNAWYRFDSQEKPQLPTREIDGIYGVYPDLIDFGTAQMKIASETPELKDIGPQAYTPWYIKTDFEDVNIPILKEVAPSTSKNVFTQLMIICALASMGVAIVVVRFVKKKR